MGEDRHQAKKHAHESFSRGPVVNGRHGRRPVQRLVVQ